MKNNELKLESKELIKREQKSLFAFFTDLIIAENGHTKKNRWRIWKNENVKQSNKNTFY